MAKQTAKRKAKASSTNSSSTQSSQTTTTVETKDLIANTSLNSSVQSSTSQQEEDAVFATITTANGQSVQLNASEFGKYIHQQYSKLYFAWTQEFISYYDSHNMAEIRNKLLSGMDKQSCDFFYHHELLLNLSRAQDHILLNRSLNWTEYDLQLIAKYEQVKNSNNYPFLQQVNRDWGTAFTSMYGLYDAQNILPNIYERVNGKAIIDGGGFIGDTLVVFRHLFPDSVIHTFEPSLDSFNYMCNLMQQDIKEQKIIAHQQALGEHIGTLKLHKSKAVDGKLMDASASLKIDYHTDSHEEVSVTTLDTYVKERDLKVGLIKLDVEGFEVEIIQGSLETIKSQRPVLIIANYHTPQEFYELKPYLESLNLNYRFELRRSCIALPLTDLVLIAYPL